MVMHSPFLLKTIISLIRTMVNVKEYGEAFTATKIAEFIGSTLSSKYFSLLIHLSNFICRERILGTSDKYAYPLADVQSVPCLCTVMLSYWKWYMGKHIQALLQVLCFTYCINVFNCFSVFLVALAVVFIWQTAKVYFAWYLPLNPLKILVSLHREPPRH